MQDLTKFVEKYGPEIAKSLGIASTQLYMKLLWYVKITGLKDLILDFIYIGIGALLVYLSHLISKKILEKSGDDSDYPIYLIFLLFGIIISYFIWSFLCFVVINGTVNDLMKFISPEYWIIDQIVKKSL